MAAWNPRANQIFLGALEIDDADVRQAHLRRECGPDADLLRQVEALLAAHAQAGSFLEQPADPELTGSIAAIPDTSATVGTKIGQFKLLEQIGEGGFGVVFLAEQSEPVRRKVALKILKPGMDTRQVVARFEAERQALAIMDHPNIAKVFDGGATASGRPYFVMELVKGVPITEFCDQHHLTPRQRLELFVPVCQAVQHAHQKGIIHRDLKPSNVMVTVHDTTPVPKVIDFGVAKALGKELTDKTLFTGFAQMIGTPLYMSPEQAGQSSLDIDTRSDIYSLGVLMYELLTGTTPFDKERFKQAAYDEIRRIIREEEPPKPSTRLSESKDSLPSISAQRHTEPAKLTKLVRGELDWIVMKALDKDRNRRYETANGFAIDVQRYLADEPVQACPPSTVYRVKKFVRRNKGPVLAASLVLLALLAGIIGTTWQAVRASNRAEGERLAKERAETNFALANEAVGKYLAAVTDDPDLRRADFHRLRKRLLESGLPLFQKLATQKSDDPEVEADRGLAYLRLVLLRHALGDNEAALQDAQATRAIFARLTAEFPAVPKYRHCLANGVHNLAIAQQRMGKHGDAEAGYRQAVDILEKLVAESPNEPLSRQDLAEGHNDLGNLLHLLKRREDAGAAHDRALEMREKLVADFPAEPLHRQKLAESHLNMGALLQNTEKVADAGAAYRRAVVILEKLVAESPTEPWYRSRLANSHHNLGSVHSAVGNALDAEMAYRKAVDVQEKLTDEFSSVPWYREQLADYLNALCNLLMRLGKHPEAEEVQRRSLDVRARLPADFPTVREYHQNMAQNHTSLGYVLLHQGKGEEAVLSFRRSLEFRKKLAATFPDVADFQKALAEGQIGLGRSLMNVKKLTEAEEVLREALGIGEKLAAGFPANVSYLQTQAETYNTLAAVLSDVKKLPEAEAAYRKSLAIREQHVAEFPNKPEFAVDLGGAYCNFGILIRDSGQPEAALDWFHKAVERLGPVAARNPHQAHAREFLCNSHLARAQTLDALGRHAEATRDWQLALELDDGNAQGELRSSLASSRLRGFRKDKDSAGCLKAAAEYDDLKRTDAGGLYDAACHRAICAAVIPEDPKTPAADAARLAREQADLAMGWLQKAVAAGFADAAHMTKDEDLDALREREDFKKLLAELQAKQKRPSGPGA